MKIKTILITAVVVVGAGAITSFFVRRSNESNVKTVEVVPVVSVNSAAYGLGDMNTVSGTIISRDTQVVALDSSHELKDVYVQQGDRVRKGDKLLEYDMLGDELKEEMEELTKMSLELSLEGMKRDLATLKSGRMPESMGGGYAPSAGGGEEDSDDGDSGDSDEDMGDDSDSDDSGQRTHADVEQQGGGAVGAADTFAAKPGPYVLAGAYSKPAQRLSVSSSWDSSDMDRRLQELDGESQKNAQNDSQNSSGQDVSKNSSEQNVSKDPSGQEEEIVSDDTDDLDQEDWDELLSGKDQEKEKTDKETDKETDNNTTLPGTGFLSILENPVDKEGYLPEPAIPVENNSTVEKVIDDNSETNETNPPDAMPVDDGTGNGSGSLEENGEFIEGTDDEKEGTGEEKEADAPALTSALEEPVPAILSTLEEQTDEIVPETNPESTPIVVDDSSGDDLSSTDGAEAEPLPGMEGPDPETYVPETDFSGDTFIDDEAEVQDSFDIIASINEFLSTVNQITLAVDGDWNQIGAWLGTIDSAIDQFRTTFANSNEYETTDLFGDNVIVTGYSVSDNVINQVGDATAKVMQTAYERLCAYHFINSVKSLNPDGLPSSALTPDWVMANEEAIRSVINELASLPQDMWIYNPSTHAFEFRDAYAGMNAPIFSGETMNEFLRNSVLSLSSNYMLQEPTDETPVVSTEGKIWNGNSGNNGNDFDGPGYTAEELAEAIKEQEKNIKETELQIREAELGIKEYKKILDGKIVYATMDGIVKNAGSRENNTGNSFITITGKAGLYVKGSINELALDTVKVGDTITGTSYETGSTFTAEIVEISEYPDESRTSYYGFGDENTNSSYYPFYAYIDNAEGLEVDSYVDLSLSNSSVSSSMDPTLSGGLSLEEYYIRTDNNGRSYCYVRGEDGLLEKRYLEVGANNWGVITIKSGLTPNDCIAFPYGDGVEEGAQTVEVDYLSAVEGEAY